MTAFRGVVLAAILSVLLGFGLVVHGIWLRKQEVLQHRNKFWQMVAVNEDANIESLFQITPARMFEEPAAPSQP